MVNDDGYYMLLHGLYDGINDSIWLVAYLPLWKMVDFVSWVYELPNIWKNKSHVPNHQPGIYTYLYYVDSVSMDIYDSSISVNTYIYW